jgi:hypothetical protein
MKKSLMLLLVIGCSGESNVATLHDDAHALVKYYMPKLDQATRRLKHVYEESGRVPKDLPGADEALRALVDARDKLVGLRRIPDEVEKALAAAQGQADLERLVQDEERKYEDGLVFVNDNVSQVESFEANALRSAPAVPPHPPVKDVPEGVIP